MITIIILLILAGITIASLKSTGLFDKAKEAKKLTEEKTDEENETLNEYVSEINKWTGNDDTQIKSNLLETNIKYTDNTELTDINGNKIVVPAGFKIVSNDDTNNATTVDKGIVIEDSTTNADGTPTATNGSQFVWIPVGNVTKEDSSIVNIELNRYSFNSEGKANALNDSPITLGNGSEFKEVTTSTYGNSTAKNLNAFKNSVLTNGGYYIGRYEARTSTKMNSVLNSDTLPQISERKTEYVYNYLTQIQASKQSQSMYPSKSDGNGKFESDLMNSLAWDTAVLVLQTFGENNKYSKQISLNSTYSSLGTTNDKQFNVYDMSSNAREWTTETLSWDTYPCIARGGIYDNGTLLSTDYRDASRTTRGIELIGFRPILYL